MPGHKGRPSLGQFADSIGRYLTRDLTELPGLDDLSQPSAVLRNLEERAAKVWGAHSSLLSVNGASGGLLAALMFLSQRGSKILVPRNCHRAVINGLVLSGLEPLWFEPAWEENWGVWGPTTAGNLLSLLKLQTSSNLAGVLIVSPTYAGAISQVKEIASICHQYGLPLIVDEAHGAHCFAPEPDGQCALSSGADIVVHSLHKTLGALTQTGLVHLSKHAVSHFGFDIAALRAALNLVQSSSPSYIFLSSVDELISSLECSSGLSKLEKMEVLGLKLRRDLNQLNNVEIYQPDFGSVKSHILLGCPNAQTLATFLMERGIYPECLLGSGLLLLLGMGSNESDVDFLMAALTEFDKSCHTSANTNIVGRPTGRPKPIDQVLPPRHAFSSSWRLLPAQESIGEIAAECVAPCPPAWPVIVPGQRIEADCLRWHDLKSLRVVVQSS